MMTDAAQYVLTRPADVDAFRRSLPLFGLGARGSLTVRVPTMSGGEQHHWERRLTFWLNACGCQTGAIMAISALAWRVSVVLHEFPHTWSAGFANLGWVLGAAVVGKIVGLAFARVLLVLDLRRLRRRMSKPFDLPLEAQP